MSVLDDYIAKHPEYKDVPRQSVADGLYKTYYADKMPRDEFDLKIGFTDPSSAEPSGRTDPLRNLQIGIQGVGKSMADLAGMPGDMANLAANALLGTADTALSGVSGAAEALFGMGDKVPSIDFRFGPSPLGSDAISDYAGKGMEAVGVDPIEYEDMSGSERLGYNINRFGTGNLAGGTGLARAAAKSAPRMAEAPRVFDSMMRPYLDDAGRVVATDTAAGVGSGAGLTLAQETLPEQMQGPLTDTLAMILGGVGGATTVAGTRAPKQVVDAFVSKLPDANVPLDPVGLMPTTRRTADNAARYMQGQATGSPAEAAESIGRSARESTTYGDPQMTAGLASGDIGLQAIERGFRTRDPIPFELRNQQLKDAAQERVEGLVDLSANPKAARRAVEKQAAMRRSEAQRKIESAEADVASVDEAARAQGGELGQYRGTGERASEQLDEVVRDTLEQELKRKNEMFRKIDPDGTVEIDGRQMADLVADVRAKVPKTVPEGEVLPEGWLSKWGELGEEGVTVTYRELEDARPALSSAIKQAQTGGNYALADNLRTLKKHIDTVADELAAAGTEAGENARNAIENFKVRFAPRFREGEGGRYARDVRDEARQFGTRTKPTRTAGRFLSDKEAATDLQGILEVAKSPEAGQKAARTWLLDQLSGAVDGKGKINPNLLAKRRDQLAGVLDTVPGLKKEVDDLVRSARRGADAENEMAQALKQARRDQKLTEDAIRMSQTAILIGEDPVEAAGKALSAGKYEAPRRIAAITQSLKGNIEAEKGWKRAVAEYMVKKVTDTNTALSGGEAGPLSIAKMQKVFKENENALAKVFSPREMNALRRAHKMLEPLGALARKATPGSQTADKKMLWNTVEAGLLAVTGNAITTGMVMKRIRVALSFLPDGQKAVAHLVNRAWFDPELAQHLLTRQVREIDKPAWNAKLNRLLAYGQYARESAKNDDD